MGEPSSTPHRLLQCAATLEAALDDVIDVDPVFMSVTEKRDSLAALERLASRVTALKLRVVAASADVADAEGHRDVASWMAHRTRGDRRQQRREQRLADACDGRWRRLGQALTTGAVHVDQAHVVSRALDDLGRVLTDLLGDASFAPVLTPDRRAGLLDEAEAHLVEQAAHFGPDDLARLGARILQVLAPHLADEAEAKKLSDEERHARRVTRLTTQRLGDGTVLVKARIPEHMATRLTTTLEAFTNPRKQCGDATQPDGPHRADDATGEDLPYEMRLGHAFCALLEGLDPQRLPLARRVGDHAGGDDGARRAPARQSAPPSSPTGETMSAGEVRRLACTADLVPAVFGTRSELLDLGRTARLFSPGQRAPWPCATDSAEQSAARSPRPGARHTTCCPGVGWDRPTWRTACSCAAIITTGSTTTGTSISACRTATSGSAGDGESTGSVLRRQLRSRGLPPRRDVPRGRAAGRRIVRRTDARGGPWPCSC